jgi:hypothetical protein
MSTLAERYWQELRPSAAAHRPEDEHELAGDGTTGRRRRRTTQPQLRRQQTRRVR